MSDEVIGYMVAMFALTPDSAHIALGFIFFRAFDIIKPWPIKWLDQRLPRGWGIISDDVAAGLLTQILLRILL